MLLQRREPPIVFGGPSLRLVRGIYGGRFNYRPPVRRGDLHDLLEQNPARRGCVLLTDGVFGESMALPPRECMDMLDAGWLLLGSSSIGALRAADCCNVGMIGVGDIFFGFRTGYFHSDADVAVLYQGENYSEISVSLAHADYFIRVFSGKVPISGIERRLLVRDLREMPWFERTPDIVSAMIANRFRAPELKDEFLNSWREPEHNPKARDALMACDFLFRYFLKSAS
ncbi:TfuA-like protein [Burkholderia stagnalis]